MNNYWNSLNQRERWMLVLAGAVSLIYLFYLLIYAPLTGAVAYKLEQRSEKANTLTWMKQAQKKKQPSSKKQVLSNSQLLTLLSDKLKTGTLSNFSYQIQQTANGDIQLSFNEVPFVLFISWLSELNKTYQLNIKQLNADRGENLGIAKLQLLMSSN